MPNHLPQLDGIRGLAVLIVIVGHTLVFGFGLGLGWLGPFPPTGVNLFFVLSGFLITGILLESRQQSHYFRNFYARRALRIWPLYFAVLLLCFGWMHLDLARVRWIYFALFVQNLAYARGLAAPLAIAITWSLAVEEQFYLLWPVVVRRYALSTLKWIALAMIAAAPLFRYVAVRLGLDPYTNPLCRFDAIAFGAVAALWLHMAQPGEQQMRKAARWLVAAAGAGELLSAAAGLLPYTSKTFVSAAFCALLLASLSLPAVARALSQPWVRFTGRISYGLYLLHVPVAMAVLALLPGAGWGIRAARCVLVPAGSYLAASLSWTLLEAPVLRLKRFFPVRFLAEPVGEAEVASASLLLTSR